MASVIPGKALAPKAVVAELSRPGPYPVLRGELALVGLPGVLFTPTTGQGLPAVAIGHDWMQPASRYLGLLRHLASWGIVAAVPDTQRGPLGSHRGLAHDLRTALGVCSGVRLGGNARGAAVSVDPGKLAVAGHGMGAGAAVLAAAVPAADTQVQAVGEPYWEVGHGVDLQAVATIALTDTKPSAVEAARAVHLPGMHLAFGKDLVSPPAAGADLVADAWAGESSLRSLKKATHLGVLEGRHWTDAVLDGKGEPDTRSLVKALLTAFVLHRLAGESRYASAFDGAIKGTEVRTPDVSAS